MKILLASLILLLLTNSAYAVLTASQCRVIKTLFITVACIEYEPKRPEYVQEAPPTEKPGTRTSDRNNQSTITDPSSTSGGDKDGGDKDGGSSGGGSSGNGGGISGGGNTGNGTGGGKDKDHSDQGGGNDPGAHDDKGGGKP